MKVILIVQTIVAGEIIKAAHVYTQRKNKSSMIMKTLSKHSTEEEWSHLEVKMMMSVSVSLTRKKEICQHED